MTFPWAPPSTIAVNVVCEWPLVATVVCPKPNLRPEQRGKLHHRGISSSDLEYEERSSHIKGLELVIEFWKKYHSFGCFIKRLIHETVCPRFNHRPKKRVKLHHREISGRLEIHTESLKMDIISVVILAKVWYTKQFSPILTLGLRKGTNYIHHRGISSLDLECGKRQVWTHKIQMDRDQATKWKVVGIKA